MGYDIEYTYSIRIYSANRYQNIKLRFVRTINSKTKQIRDSTCVNSYEFLEFKM